MNDTSPLFPPAPAPAPGPAPGYGSGSAQGPGSPTTTPPGQRPRRGAFAASVVAASLLVGGAAGVGGAAAWDEWHSGSTTGFTDESTTSQVVSAPAGAAPKGSVEQVAQQVLPSVVKIDVSGPQESGSGSGIVLSSDGKILTNNHVVAVAGSSGSIRVSFNNGKSAPAKILGTDPLTDTAVIQAQNVSGLTPATIGNSSALRVGQGVVAIGSPYGLESTVTSGIVSALDRPVAVGSDAQGNSTTYPAIQTDAAINPGNSGGPLVDLAGRVVGIDSSIRTSTTSPTDQGGSIGLGFAIPIDEVMPIVDQMVKGETPTHARLGISVSDVANPTGTSAAQGAQVQQVTPGSTGAQAGLAKGDVITKVDGHLITGADSLVATIRSYRPGDTVTLTFQQGGSSRTVQVRLESDARTTAG